MQPPNNTGSFGAATGGVSPELAAAMQRRSGGNPGGAMSQVSQGAAIFDPTTQQPSPVASQGTPSMPQTVGQPKSESSIIIQALKGRLEALSKGGILQ